MLSPVEKAKKKRTIESSQTKHLLPSFLNTPVPRKEFTKRSAEQEEEERAPRGVAIMTKDSSPIVDFIHSLPLHDFNMDHWTRSLALTSITYSSVWMCMFGVTLIAISQFQRSCLCGRREAPKPTPPLGWKPAMLMVGGCGGMR